MILPNNKVLSLIFAITLINGGCGISTDEETAAEEENTVTTYGTAAADSLDDLKLSHALALTLPDALGGDGSSGSLRLVDGAKSAEACEVGQLVKEGIGSLGEISNLFCHLEVESDQFTFGNKYDITLAGTEESDPDDGMTIQIWVDNSKVSTTGELTVSMCNNYVLRQVFTITGINSDGAKGEIVNKGSEDYEGQEQTWAENVAFDLNFTESGRSILNVKSKHSSDSDTYRQHIVIDLKDEGVSNMRVSRTGSWQGDSFAQMGAAKHDGDFGQVLFANSWSGTDSAGNQQSHDFTKRSYFDNEGFIVGSDTISSFAEGQVLFVADVDVPKELTADFEPGDFAVDAWDCSTDEAITVVMSGENGALHNACDSNRGDWVNCYDQSEYQSSNEEHEIDESSQKETEEFDHVESE